MHKLSWRNTARITWIPAYNPGQYYMFQLQQGPVLAATGHQLCNPVAVLLSAQHPVSDAGESITPSTGTLLDTEVLAELSSTDVFDSETLALTPSEV